MTDSIYSAEITSPQQTWTITHMLGGPVIVELFDLAEQPLAPWAAESIVLVDKDTAVIHFKEPTMGKARIVLPQMTTDMRNIPVFADKAHAPANWAALGVELFDVTAQSGYLLQRKLPNGDYICVWPIMFEGVQLTIGPNLMTWRDAYWYTDPHIGVIAALAWDPTLTDDPGLHWKRHIGEGGVDEYPQWYREEHPEQFDEHGAPLG